MYIVLLQSKEGSNLSIYMSHSVADCQGVLIGEQEVIRRIGFEGWIKDGQKKERKE